MGTCGAGVRAEVDQHDASEEAGWIGQATRRYRRYFGAWYLCNAPPRRREFQHVEFSAWLRTQTTKHHRPFQEETIRSYAETAHALDLWMAKEDIDGDFTARALNVLNGFFAAYRNSHSQGGTNTRPRNQRHLFNWLALRYDHPDPWTDDMVRYGPVKSRPSTLAAGAAHDDFGTGADGPGTAAAE